MKTKLQENRKLETMFRISPRKLEDAGMEIVEDADGSIEFRGELSPIAFFEHDAVMKIVREIGEREADALLDKAAHTIQVGMFLHKFGKML